MEKKSKFIVYGVELYGVVDDMHQSVAIFETWNVQVSLVATYSTFALQHSKSLLGIV